MIRIILKEQQRPTERDAEYFNKRGKEKGDENLNANIEFILSYKDNGEWILRFLRRLSLQDWQKIRPLSDNKITKVLGNGSYGFAFLLDNDHVLKLGSVRSSGNEIERTVQNKQNSFSGNKSFKRNDLHVYDSGEIQIPILRDGIHWREVPRYTVLYNILNPDENEEMTSFFIEAATIDMFFVGNGTKIRILKFNEWLNNVKQNYKYDFKNFEAIFDEKQQKQLLKLLYTEGVRYIKTIANDNITAQILVDHFGEGPDAHPGNIGFDEVTRSFVLFDF